MVSKADIWPCRQGDVAATGLPRFVGPRNLEYTTSWCLRAHGINPVVDADCNIYIPHGNRRVYIATPDGRRRKVIELFPDKREDEVQLTCHPVLADGAYFTATAGGVAVCYDLRKDQVRWTASYCARTAADIFSAGVGLETLLLAGCTGSDRTFNEAVFGLSVTDGKTLWKYEVGVFMLQNNFTPNIFENTAIFSQMKGEALRIGIKDGALRWKTEDVRGYPRSFAGCVVGRVTRLVYLPCNKMAKKQWNQPNGGKGLVRAFSVANGKLEWEQAFELECHSCPTLVPVGGKTVVVVPLGATPGPMPQTEGQQVTGDAWTGQIVGLEAKSGELLWRTVEFTHHGHGVVGSLKENGFANQPLLTNPAASADGSFYIVCQGLYAKEHEGGRGIYGANAAQYWGPTWGGLFRVSASDGQLQACWSVEWNVYSTPVVGPGFLFLQSLERGSYFFMEKQPKPVILRDLERPLAETGTEHFWPVKPGPVLDNQGLALDRAPLDLSRPASFWNYALYSDDRMPSDDSLYNTPVIDSQRNIYISANLSDLFVIRPDGRLRGSINVGPLARTPCFQGPYCYVCNGDGFMVCFSIETLDEKWRRKLGQHALSVAWDSPSGCVPTVKRILAGFTCSKRHQNGADFISALDPESGDVQWEYQLPYGFWSKVRFDGPYNVVPGVLDGSLFDDNIGRVVIADSHKGNAFCFSLETGAEFWRYHDDSGRLGMFTTANCCVSPRAVCYNCWCPNNPAREDGRAGRLNTCSGGYGWLEAIDVRTGQLKFKREWDMEAFITPTFVPAEVSKIGKDTVLVLLGSNCGGPKDSSPDWKHPGQGDAWEGRIVSLDAETGEDVWVWDAPVWRGYTYKGSDKDDFYLPDAWSNPAVVTADGVIYASFLDGQMYAVSVTNGELRSKYDMKGCCTGNPAVAPGLLAAPCQFGVYIWRDRALEDAWLGGDDTRKAGFSGESVGGPWEDTSFEWFRHNPPCIEDVVMPAAAMDDVKRWHELREEVFQEAIRACKAWSEEMRLPETKAEPAQATKMTQTKKKTDPSGPSDAGAGTRWEVIGGGSKGGIVVRLGEGLKTQELGRLETGAEVEEMEISGERLHYRLISGEGPNFGWVSTHLKGTPLLNKK
mmetsp:Transcript_115957/g.322934  ORF Transcript_115957/g.322934 Transcript_115957/m.322934 type:complete len:1119 (+) Transcript_115957:59-3415(+)